MSNFIQPTVHPVTGKTEDATWIDHGWQRRPAWTVLFPDGTEFAKAEVSLPAGSTYADILTGADPSEGKT